jgi:glutathione peroxidase
MKQAIASPEFTGGIFNLFSKPSPGPNRFPPAKNFQDMPVLKKNKHYSVDLPIAGTYSDSRVSANDASSGAVCFDRAPIVSDIAPMKIFLLLAALFFMQIVHAQPIFTIPVKDIDKKETSLNVYKGKVLLIVNVASKCGFTPQYTALEATYEKFKDQGLVILGFPCNQFGSQEPGTNEEIKQFCSSKYSVTFPLFDKIEVNGANRHPLYTMLAGSDSPVAGNIKWNFTKFLVGRDGKIISRFESKTTPDSAEIIKAIETALAAK